MMTYDDLIDALEHVTWFPGWELTIYLHGDEGPGLKLYGVMPDTRDPDGAPLELLVRTPIPPCRNEDEFYNWLDWRLKRLAIHEHHENFRIDGKVWVDPHAEEYWDAVPQRTPETFHVRPTPTYREAMG